MCILNEKMRGDCVRAKRELQKICCRLYLFILLDNIKGRIGCFFVDVAKLGEPCISMSLLFYAFSVFIFLQYFVFNFFVIYNFLTVSIHSSHKNPSIT